MSQSIKPGNPPSRAALARQAGAIKPHVANPPRKADDEPPHWLEKPSTIRALWIIQIVVLALLVLIDITMVEHHPHFEADKSIAFYSWYGFVTCVVMVVGSKYGVSLLLKRRDTYYDGDPYEWVDPSADAESQAKATSTPEPAPELALDAPTLQDGPAGDAAPSKEASP